MTTLNKAGTFLTKFVEWKLDDRVQQIVSRTVFKYFCNLRDNFNQCHILLEAIIGKFDIIDSCFKVGPQDNPTNLVLTLEDVLYITGLPIDGNPVTGAESTNYRQLIHDKLGRVPETTAVEEGGKKNNNFQLEWLRANFENVPPEVGDNEIWFYVRAYLLFVIGCFLFPDVSSLQVPMMYLPLLTDVEQINGYAWGAGLLAYLLSSLRQRGAKGQKTVKGCTPLLFLFFFIRAPHLASEVLDDPFILEQHAGGQKVGLLRAHKARLQFPLMVSLFNVLQRPLKNSRNVKSRDDYEDYLDHEVSLQPYVDLGHDFIPANMQPQLHLRFSLTCIICFEKISHHRADIAFQQFDVDEVEWNSNLAKIPQLPVFDEKMRSQRSGKKPDDWAKIHKCYVDTWLERWERCLLPVGENVEGETCRVEGSGVGSPFPFDVQESPTPVQGGHRLERVERSTEESCHTIVQEFPSHVQEDPTMELNDEQSIEPIFPPIESPTFATDESESTNGDSSNTRESVEEGPASSEERRNKRHREGIKSCNVVPPGDKRKRHPPVTLVGYNVTMPCKRS